MAEVGIPYALETPLGTLVFNEETEGPRLRLTDIDGLDGAQVRSSSEPRPQADGAIVYPSFRGPKVPTMQGQIIAGTTGDPALDLENRTILEDRLRGCVNSLMRADGILRWTPSGHATRRLTVRVLDRLAIGNQPGILKTFQIALIAGDPTTYGDDEIVAELPAPTAGGGGWIWPFSFPFSFGSTFGAVLTVTNGGSADTFPVVRIPGPASGPEIINQTTGQRVTLTALVIPAGGYVDIDMRQETVRLNGGASAIGFLEPATSEFWALVPGPNDVQLVATNTSAATVAVVTYRDGYP